MTATTTLSSKFQLSIPKSVRELQHWSPGQEFVFIPSGRSVLMMPVPEREELAAIARGAHRTGYRDRDDRYATGILNIFRAPPCSASDEPGIEDSHAGS